MTERLHIGTADRTPRILFVANDKLPTLEINFLLPLHDLQRNGEIDTDLVTEKEINERFGRGLRRIKIRRWLQDRFAKFQPTVVVFCRYSGPYGEYLLDLTRYHNVPTVYYIDDDLLNVPREVGREKYRYHNETARRAAVKYFLESADLVYCSTPRLADRLKKVGAAVSPVAGAMSCGGQMRVPAHNEPIRRIGYMGRGHEHDFETVIPAIVTLLRQSPEIEFELFGLEKPAVLDEFRGRVTVLNAILNYEEFLAKLAQRRWQIGICPLADSPFNLVKTEIKWVDYTSVGAAVVASGGTVYDECCADGCGILARTPQEWEGALNWLVQNPDERFAMAIRAEKKLEENYSFARLRDQVFEILDAAKTAKKIL